MKKILFLLAVLSLTFATSHAQTASTLSIVDLRTATADDVPFSFSGVKAELHPTTLLGFPNYYTGVTLSLSPHISPNWGKAYQLHFNDHGMYFRWTGSTTEWNAWQQVLTERSSDGSYCVGNDIAGNTNILGKKLMFLGASENTDPLWIARYNRAPSKTDLRISIGDNPGDSRLVIGRTVSSAWFPLFVFTNSGRAGIGLPVNQDPTNALDVNGTIRAKEVKVETGWADFVFKEGYRLPSLGEVKQHIEENKHLPGIPSEAEVQENGVNLGEMQAKLLQKIEELTLYVIQQQETIEKQQQMIEVLQEKVENK
jgi:hypothetical protein